MANKLVGPYICRLPGPCKTWQDCTINNFDPFGDSSGSVAENSSVTQTSQCCLGTRSPDNTSHLYKGYLDQLRVFNRTLTSQEIQKLYIFG